MLCRGIAKGFYANGRETHGDILAPEENAIPTPRIPHGNCMGVLQCTLALSWIYNHHVPLAGAHEMPRSALAFQGNTIARHDNVTARHASAMATHREYDGAPWECHGNPWVIPPRASLENVNNIARPPSLVMITSTHTAAPSSSAKQHQAVGTGV